jgi:putative FmdB family regulatory protein
MPIYEYRCADCAKTFEKLRSMRESDQDVHCPECESDKVERLLSGFAMAGCSSTPGSRFT